ncbi:MAG: DNA topoisomerase 3 [Bacteroidales bacterium]|nr:DNA topoisomerase 3 [Bacteroidales bacterium]
MIVCIAEKPSVARDIAKVLGATVSRDGYMEGNGYQVTWTFGHLCTLKEPHDYTPLWKPWDLDFLPMIPERFGIKLISNQTYERQFHVIERLMQAADCIINCGDAGQEGELIQRWVMQKARARCPVQRLWISSLTEEAIREGFKNLRPQSDYQSLFEAALCRAIGDWLLGMNATRLYTLRYRQMQRQVLSVGRVQTPTLALIVRRQMEIDHFKPTQYWVLSTRYRDTLFTITDPKKELRKKNKDDESADPEDESIPSRSEQEWMLLLDAITGQPFTVGKVTKKEGREAPPRLFDLTSLQVECNKKFGFSADETLRYIQSLYEKKLTTYPRVDTTFLSDDIYPKCPTILQGMLPYRPLIEPLLGARLPKSKKVFDSSKVTDHHAIIHTGVNPAGGDVTYNEKKVYDLVARRFIAVFYPDCRFAATAVLGSVVARPLPQQQEGESVWFKATGKVILDEGWRRVFANSRSQQDDDEKKEDERVLPEFNEGESGPHEPMLTEKWTSPPKPYTEATLLRAMETAGKLVDSDELRDALKENGIGRPSTRAAIIETLFKRGYIRKERKNLIATPTGIDLIAVIHEDLLKSAELTGQWEKKLRDIEAHRYDAATFIGELKMMVWQIVSEVKSDNSNRRVAAVAVPEPTRAAAKRKSAASKTEKPKTSRKKKTADKVSPSDTASSVASQTAASQSPIPTSTASQSAVSQNSIPLSATPSSASPQAFAAAPSPYSAGQFAGSAPSPLVKEGDICPLCGKGRILRGRTAYGCSEWRAGCSFRQPL